MPLFAIQILLGAAGLMLLAAWPPTSGEMMLVPLDGSDTNAVLLGAAAAGVQVLGAGPLPHSLVIVGERSRVVAHFGYWRALVVARAAAGCAASQTAQVTS